MRSLNTHCHVFLKQLETKSQEQVCVPHRQTELRFITVQYTGCALPECRNNYLRSHLKKSPTFSTGVQAFIFLQTTVSDFGKTRPSYGQPTSPFPQTELCVPTGRQQRVPFLWRLKVWISRWGQTKNNSFQVGVAENRSVRESLYRPPSKCSTPTLVSTCKRLIQQRFLTNLQLLVTCLPWGIKSSTASP